MSIKSIKLMMMINPKAGKHVLYLLCVIAYYLPKASAWPFWVYFSGIDVRLSCLQSFSKSFFFSFHKQVRWQVCRMPLLFLSGVWRSRVACYSAVMAPSRRNTVICRNKQTAAVFPRFNAFLVLSDKPLIPEILHVFINSFSAALWRVAAYQGFSACSFLCCGRGLNFSSCSNSTYIPYLTPPWLITRST